jgi:hypothetical protein
MSLNDFEIKKQEMVMRIKELHTSMTELILYNNIKPSVWNDLVDDLMNKRTSTLQLILSFLTELHDGIWNEMNKVWTQPNMTSEMWHNYKLFFDKPQLVEQKQMFQLRQRLRIQWGRFRESMNNLRMKQRENESTQDSEQTETGTHDPGSTDQTSP